MGSAATPVAFADNDVVLAGSDAVLGFRKLQKVGDGKAGVGRKTVYIIVGCSSILTHLCAFIKIIKVGTVDFPGNGSNLGIVSGCIVPAGKIRQCCTGGFVHLPVGYQAFRTAL